MTYPSPTFSAALGMAVGDDRLLDELRRLREEASKADYRARMFGLSFLTDALLYTESSNITPAMCTKFSEWMTIVAKSGLDFADLRELRPELTLSGWCFTSLVDYEIHDCHVCGEHTYSFGVVEPFEWCKLSNGETFFSTAYEDWRCTSCCEYAISSKQAKEWSRLADEADSTSNAI